MWNFLQQILDLGLRLLQPGSGQYMTHCNGKGVSGVLEKYEKILENLRISDSDSGQKLKCQFLRSESFVPSFLEVWVFYKLKLTSVN